jgi:thioredoxin-related protein
MMTIMGEVCQAIQEDIDAESDEGTDKKEEKMRQIIVATKPTCLFFNRLVKEGKDVAYYGDTVLAGDVDAVLVRWKISDNEYRVVFGDLTTKDVSAEDLAQLENLRSE